MKITITREQLQAKYPKWIIRNFVDGKGGQYLWDVPETITLEIPDEHVEKECKKWKLNHDKECNVCNSKASELPHRHGENGFHSRVITHTGFKQGYYLEAICIDDGIVYQNNRINEDLKARE